MSRISSFIKTRQKQAGSSRTQPQSVAQEPQSPEEKVAAQPVATSTKKEEWEADVVEVEIVPVSVPKPDVGSDFEDEDMELPSAKGRKGWEWQMSEAAKQKVAERLKAEEEAARIKAEKKASSILKLKASKTPTVPDDSWASLDDSRKQVVPSGTAAAQPKATPAPWARKDIAPVAPAPKKAPKPKPRREVPLLLATAASQKVQPLKCRDIWSAVGSWNSAEHFWPMDAKTSAA